MRYKDFIELLNLDERENLDFKLECHAFKSKVITHNAELVKDICAMSNNRNLRSFIIIGVSNDGSRFKSVKNTKLTEENVQDLCKNAIYPIPEVKLINRRWSDVQLKFKNIDFIIIIIGPHRKKTAYRINKDFIDYKNRICIRKNDIWIRQGSISRLASPEEVATMFKEYPKKKFPKPEKNVNYLRLNNDDRFEILRRDLQHFVSKNSGIFYRHRNIIIDGLINQNRIVLRINLEKILFKYIFIPEATKKFSIWSSISPNWCYEPTVLILSNGTVSKNSFHSQFSPHFNEKWGWISYLENPNFLLPEPYFKMPPNIKKYGIFLITLPNIKDTNRMFNSIYNMLDFLKNNMVIYSQLKNNQENMKKNIELILREDLIVKTNRMILTKLSKSDLKKEEIYDEKRFGSWVMKVTKPKELIKELEKILSLLK